MSKTLEEGSYGFMTCADHLPEHVGITQFKWFYRLQYKQHPVTPDERIFIDNNGKDLLYMSYI